MLYREDVENSGVIKACRPSVSFALDSCSKAQDALLECPDVTEVLQNMQQRFPGAFDSMIIRWSTGTDAQHAVAGRG